MIRKQLWLAVALGAVAIGAAHADVTGVVADSAGHYQNAVVCLDLNNNARCDAGEPTATTDVNGFFALSGGGSVVANIAAGTTTLAGNPVTASLVFRAPAGSPNVVSAITTEVQALMDANSTDYLSASTQLAARVGVSQSQILEDPSTEGNPAALAALTNEIGLTTVRIRTAMSVAGSSGNLVTALRTQLALDTIKNVVVIYLENRSFDNVFGAYPGANGLKTAGARAIKQVDRDAATQFTTLPDVWGGLTAAGQTPAVTQAQTHTLYPNAPFQVDGLPPPGATFAQISNTIVTRDLYHRFFENQMQVDGGRSDQYAAWGDSGGLTMGYFDGSQTQLWTLAKQYTVADNFFQAVWGGSFLNHQYLICACAPTVPAATVAANGMSKNTLGVPNANGVVQLAANTSQSASAVGVGATAPSLKTGNIAPLDYFGAGDGYRAVNTMQPAFQPSGNKPVDNTGNDALYANPGAATTLPAQTQTNIGDLLTAKGIGWAWYSGGWAAATANSYTWNGTSFNNSTTIYNANASGTSDASHGDFQAHHQPFNYFANLDPVSHAADRASHLKDRADLLNDAAAGTLPPVVFYKPIGFMNQHPGYTNLTVGDAEISTVIAALKASPQWSNMLVVVTYDEFGGQFDHVAPPKGDLLGPGTRIPAVFISPFVKKGAVDHSQYDTASVLRFITHRYSLTPLAGLTQRDNALVANGAKPMGYLGGALSFGP